MRPIDIRCVTLGYLLNEIALNVAEPDRVTIPYAEMGELIPRMAQGLRDQERRMMLAERLRDAADLIEKRPVVATRRATTSGALRSKVR